MNLPVPTLEGNQVQQVYEPLSTVIDLLCDVEKLFLVVYRYSTWITVYDLRCYFDATSKVVRF